MKNAFLGFLVFPFFLAAQQIPHSALFNNIIQYYNPAYTGKDFKLKGGLQYRNTFANGNFPQDHIYAHYEQNIDSLHSGFGLVLAQERFGWSVQQAAIINYRYEHRFSRRFAIQGGVGLGVSRYFSDFDWASGVENAPPSVDDTKPQLNAGIALSWFNLSVGYSVLQLNRASYTNYRAAHHHTLYADYTINLNRQWKTNLLLFAMTDSFDLIVQPSVRLIYKHLYYFQLGGRNLNGYHIGAGFAIKKNLHLGYNFEQSWSKLTNAVNFNRHEFFINYALVRPKRKPAFGSIGTPAF
jgi:type IX secretion system PorP/SprF family membrane protein